jgi:hypothetical protein
MSSRDPEIEAWINRARDADVWQVLNRIAGNHAVKARGRRGVGPCPSCGGKDRFSVDGNKGSFYCRGHAREGGDVIAMVMHITGASFMGACEEITGEAMPKRKPGDDVRRADPKLIEQRRLDAEAERNRRETEARDYRQREIDRAHTIWNDATAIAGTPAENYLRGRGVAAPTGARLRFHRDLKFWHYTAEGIVALHRGFAMVARIDDADHRFIGCHCTWIDLSTRKGKAEIIDPESGEILPAKKVRGSQKGGHIHLGGDPRTARHLVTGEGIETTLAVREAMRQANRDLGDCLFWASINLGNIGGPSARTVPHPTLRRTDKKGRVRRVFVPGPDPAADAGDEPVLMPPPQITRATILGDGDSDRFTTECTLLRGANRWRQLHDHMRAEIAWPGEGVDFCDLMMAGQE